jgi:hypothetical protein
VHPKDTAGVLIELCEEIKNHGATLDWPLYCLTQYSYKSTCMTVLRL